MVDLEPVKVVLFRYIGYIILVCHIETRRPWLHEEPVGHDRVFGESHR